MKEISFTELRKLTLEDLQGGACLKIPGSGWDGPALYVIPKVEGPMRLRVEGICSQIDTGAGSLPVVPPTPVGDLINNYRNGAVADPKEAREALLKMGISETALDGEEE